VLYRFKNCRELFDGYKHRLVMEYVETGVLEGEGEEDERPELNVVCQLTVNNVMSDDCGEVECRAFNDGGLDSTTAQLYMRCTSHVDSIAADLSIVDWPAGNVHASCLNG